jgi:hypothetical protein
LKASARDDVVNDRVPDVTNGEHDGGGCGADASQITRKPKYRPVVVDCTEASVKCVGESPVVDELCADIDVGASLVSSNTSSLNATIKIKLKKNLKTCIRYGVESRAIC